MINLLFQHTKSSESHRKHAKVSPERNAISVKGEFTNCLLFNELWLNVFICVLLLPELLKLPVVVV